MAMPTLIVGLRSFYLTWMHDITRNLMVALAEGAEEEEALAGRLHSIAVIARKENATNFAEAFEALARMRRVLAIEKQAKLAALVERYGELPTKSSRS